MSHADLQQAAIACLAKAFNGDDIPAHVVQAAVSVILTPAPKT